MPQSNTDQQRKPILVIIRDLPAVSISELHARVGETINRVHFGKQPILVTNRGKPYAILVPVEQGADEVELVGVTTPEEAEP